jgi:acetyl-CoA decarbonylase/synthase complex subunit gamma
MPAKELSPIEVYKLLPGTNCKECGETNCMAFAAKLVNREAMLQGCPPLLEAKSKAAFDKLWALLKPAVRAVVVGTGERKATLGGEYVMYRHEFTYFNLTAIAIDVTDEMPDEELEARIKTASGFEYDYIGMKLKLDMIAVRSTSNDAAKFQAAGPIRPKHAQVHREDPLGIRRRGHRPRSRDPGRRGDLRDHRQLHDP